MRFFAAPPAAAHQVLWPGFRLNEPDWSNESRSLAMHLLGDEADRDIYLIANAHREGHTFELHRARDCFAVVIDALSTSPEFDRNLGGAVAR